VVGAQPALDDDDVFEQLAPEALVCDDVVGMDDCGVFEKTMQHALHALAWTRSSLTLKEGSC